MILFESKMTGALRRGTLMLLIALVLCPGAHAIPPERRRAKPFDYCKLAMVAGSLALAGAGALWTHFDSPPPEPIELTIHGVDSAATQTDGLTAQAREWEAVLDSGQAIEARIPRTGRGFRTVTLFDKGAGHRMLGDMARAQLAKHRPEFDFGHGPGIEIPIDRLELRRQANGDLKLIFYSPLGELRSQSPIPREALFSGAPIVVSLGPLNIDGEGDAKSAVEAALQFRFVGAESRFEVQEMVIRIRVKVPSFFIDTSDETRIPAVSTPLAPVK